MEKRSLLQISLPALLLGSTLGECVNDKAGGKVDSGCTLAEPICVDVHGKEAALHHRGTKCAACVNDYAIPDEPDWGCTKMEPLCVLVDPLPDHDSAAPAAAGGGRNRPLKGFAGTTCAPYPCQNTEENPNDPDLGCTPLQPTCVDALGNEPVLNSPGIQCVSPFSLKEKESTKTSKPPAQQSVTKKTSFKSAWGLLPDTAAWRFRNEAQQQQKLFSSTRDGGGAANHPSSSSSCAITGDVAPLPAGHRTTLCKGCPFGMSKQCGLGSLSW